MQQALAPWFAPADAFMPQWRERIQARERISVVRSYRHTEIELHQLREAMELFALALTTQPATFIAMLRGDDEVPVHLMHCQGEQLRLRVEESHRTYPLKALFTKGQASDAFHATRMTLIEQCETADPDHTVRLHVELEFHLNSSTPPAYIAGVLMTIDLDVFQVEAITLVVRWANSFESIDLSHMFQQLELFRSIGTTVMIKLYLPGLNEHVKGTFAQWKILFGLVARAGEPQTFPPLSDSSSSGVWTVTVECSAHDTADEYMIDLLTGRSGTQYTTARLFIASLLPLIHGEVSHIELIRPLEDESDSYEDYDEKPVRKKWLTFFLSNARCQSWSLQSIDLDEDDNQLIKSISKLETVDELLEELWMNEWENTEDFYETHVFPDGVVELYEDVRGVVNKALLQERPGSMTTTQPLLLSIKGFSVFSLCCLPDSGCLFLNDLTLNLTSATLLDVDHILQCCPSLSKLTISLVNPTEDEIVSNDAAPFSHKHPLRVLRVGIECLDALVSLPWLLRNYSIALETLSLLLPENCQPQDPMKDPRAIMDTLLMSTSRTLTTLSISGLAVAACAIRQLWASDLVTRPVLSSLILDDVIWRGLEWLEFLSCLENESHPLTLSLESIHLCVSSREQDTTKLFAMLEMNLRLTNVEIISSLVGMDLLECQHRALVTNGVVTRRKSGPLPIRQKLALLSGLVVANVAWDQESITQVFDFAAPSASRQITIRSVAERKQVRI